MSETCAFTPPYPLKIAVLFLVFNRLSTTKRVFEVIRKAKPPRLYIAADGPRANKASEVKKVKEVREYIFSNIDWQCEVKTLFRDENLGCKHAISGAISWFFENEEMGIILEDDCLPSQSFFWFCEELLEYYMDDERIFMISGYNRQNVWNPEQYDYFFSHLGGIWGWASWRRAWKYYDGEMKELNLFASYGYFESLLGDKLGKERHRTLRNAIKLNIDSWAYPWGFARHKNSGMTCVPSKSLVMNIGFGTEATHTFGANTDGILTHEISFPLKKNCFIVADELYDLKFQKIPMLPERILKDVIVKIRNYLVEWST